MELWINGWMDYLFETWRNATINDYLKMMLCVVVVGGFFSLRGKGWR